MAIQSTDEFHSTTWILLCLTLFIYPEGCYVPIMPIAMGTCRGDWVPYLPTQWQTTNIKASETRSDALFIRFEKEGTDRKYRARNSRGPWGHWPPDFPNGPPILKVEGPKGPQYFQPPRLRINIHVRGPGILFGPLRFKERGPEGPTRKISSFEPCKYGFKIHILFLHSENCPMPIVFCPKLVPFALALPPFASCASWAPLIRHVTWAASTNEKAALRCSALWSWDSSLAGRRGRICGLAALWWHFCFRL